MTQRKPYQTYPREFKLAAKKTGVRPQFSLILETIEI